MNSIDYKVAEIKDIKKSGRRLTLTLSIDREFRYLSDKDLEVTMRVNEVNSQYKQGDLVKFEEGKPEMLAKIPTDNMDYTEFHALENRIRRMTCEELIATHQSLIGKVDASRIHEGDFYSYYIARVLNTDYGYSVPKECGEEVIKFLNSKHVSDYFKTMITEKIKDKKISKENKIHTKIVKDALESDRTISEFDGKELGAIYRVLQGFYDYSDSLIFSLAFKLDSQGAIDFLNKIAHPISIIKRIVTTSGLSDRPEYYSGRGATRSDLNGQQLISIYKKLARIDKKKALNMVKMTMSMPTLGATEFLESLYILANNGFNFNEENISTNNNSLGGSRGIESFAVGMAILAETFGRGYRPDETSTIKREFKWLLPEDVSILIKETNSYEDNYKGYRK